jgi:type VI secretion system secreted protein VgrG
MAFTQKDRRLRVNTPLGTDKLLVVTLSGTEALSQLYRFDLTLLAENATDVAFDKIIGQPIAVEMDMPGGKKRHFHGLCSRLSQGRRDDVFTHYRMEIVPQAWLLSRKTQCRIFQHITVPDILKAVLKELDVKWDIKGKFHERDYCVQYRESDFAFASRLMEEEGIYFYFVHSDKGHQMVVANTPQGHADVAVTTSAIFDDARGGNRPELRVTEWEKVQELRSGKITLWDNCFELPQQNLEARATIQESVKVGTVEHKLKVGGNDKLELYDYPGAYAQRFDGIDPGGAARPDDLKHIFEDNARVAKLHAEREAAESLTIHGSSNCGQFSAGQKFKLERHFNADGQYVLTEVRHDARIGADYRSGEADTLQYDNRFTCIPLALPYRPPLRIAKPGVRGTQTATVVGPTGEPIFCDKYGRIKVQFHWDREGKKNADSSCWIRVSQNWGGGSWGSMTIPHVGHEVIVDFEEGDPDRPLIVGRVYNAECMPPLTLPGHKTKTMFRDHGGNQIYMEGDKGKESIVLSSPNGGTSIALGYHPPSTAPIGAGAEEFKQFLEAQKKAQDEAEAKAQKAALDTVKKKQPSDIGAFNFDPSNVLPVGKLNDATFSIFSGGQWSSHIQGNYGHIVEGDSTTTNLGVTKTLYCSDVYTECWANNDTIVQGNYTCRVNGYQEYFTKGHYVTKVLGANWVTIIGGDTNFYASAQQTFNVGTHLNVYANARFQIEKVKDVRKIAKVQRLEGKIQAKIGEYLQKAANKKVDVAGTLREKAKEKDLAAERWKNKISDEYKLEAASLRKKADKIEAKAAKQFHKGNQMSIEAETKINDSLKVS